MENNEHTHFISRGCPCLSEEDHAKKDSSGRQCNKLHATDWLRDLELPDSFVKTDIVEVRFKNSRKDFYRTDGDLNLTSGDIVAVESSPGHDIGIVSLSGELVKLQMKKRRINPNTAELRKVYRKAKATDIEKWILAVKQESETMFRSRDMASSLKLSMKISDVEYQGDRTKAIFYYTADERVDFRELIRVLAEAFNVRIEMRQIGMRQEASRLGGIGSCGRELCCATWLTHFRSVSTNAARTQQLSLNPQKLAGQCSKLKCCINYENDVYNDALKDFPHQYADLYTQRGTAAFQKVDILRKMMGYAYKDNPSQLIMISVERVRQIMDMNRKKQHPPDLISDQSSAITEKREAINQESNLEDSLTRFDNPIKSRRKKKKGKGNNSAND